MPTTGPSPSSRAPARAGSTTVRHGAAIGPRPMADEDRGRCDLRRQGARLQPALSADVRALPRRAAAIVARANGATMAAVHAGFRLGRAVVAPSVRATMARGRVENQVGVVRQRFFSPRLRVKICEELNARAMDRCIAHARAQPHPDSGTRRSGRCSRRSGRASCPMPAPSTASTRCPPRPRRPASCASTTTSTRQRRAPSAGRSRSGPRPNGSSCARTAASSAAIVAPPSSSPPTSPSANGRASSATPR
jgi:hypothetical protein